ncbi:hypothetical protein TWF694_009349 [Orbilia ellipsospora]|uniref:Uncharacterized protein n=1 Tax=Orbilia ellipsospora TaxID=2528407 RepID=A0AAV9XLA7_9PEZI
MAAMKSMVARLAPSTQSGLLKSHIVLVVVILSGVVGIFGTFALCTFLFLRCRCARRREIGIAEQEDMMNSIIPPTTIKTELTTKSGSSADTFPRRPASLGDDYDVIGFGNCQAEGLESIAGSSGCVLPGDVFVPENGASTARSIRDTSAILTPPLTPEKCKLPAIEHWYHQDTTLKSRGKVGSGLLPGLPPHARRNFVGSDQSLPFLQPLNRRRRGRNTGDEQPIFGTAERSSMKQRNSMKLTGQFQDRSRSSSRQRPTQHKLRRFGELEVTTANRRVWKEKYRKHMNRERGLNEIPLSRNASYETMRPGLDVDMADGEASDWERKYDGYRESIISAYRKASAGQEETETCFWKPLPKPPPDLT